MTKDDGQRAERLDPEVLEALRVLGGYRKTAVLRNRIAIVFLCIAVGLTVFAMGTLLY